MNKLKNWQVIGFLMIFITCLHVFFEWVFFVTKPSFMSGVNFFIKLDVLFESMLFVAVCTVIPVLLIALLDQIIKNSYINKAMLVFGIALPSLSLSFLILILMDNFTYSLFKLGVVNTSGQLRAAYIICLFVIFLALHQKITGYVQYRSGKRAPLKKPHQIIAVIILSIGIFSAVARNISNGRSSVSEESPILHLRENMPNIILIGSDGLASEHLSAYGYNRETTPNIDALLPKALVFENVFTNSATTGGSLITILTSKNVTQTRVLYFPDTLRGDDSFEHLPGVLKELGYYTEQLTMPRYGDAYVFNVKKGFDKVNFNQLSMETNPVIDALIGENASYFTGMIAQRVVERILHLAYIKHMVNPFIDLEYSSITDDQRLNEIISAVNDHDGPVFMHVHMMDTHGPEFRFREQYFSAGLNPETDNGNWNLDFYDDAIRGFDERMMELFEQLRTSGELENTVVILYTDHGFQHTTNQRIPLIFWFPGYEHTGKFSENVQNIDIAPTILDYLMVPIPQWMEGRSLLKPISINTPSYIFNANLPEQITKENHAGIELDFNLVKPPFYQIGVVGLIVCDRWFDLYLHTPALKYGKVSGHTSPCSSGDVPTPQEAQSIILQHLSGNGFDIENFPLQVPVSNP